VLIAASGSIFCLDSLRPSSVQFKAKYGPTAFVAGASEGLGAAWANFLAQQGLDIIIIARHGDALEATAKQLREKYGVAVVADVLDLSDGAAVVSYAERLFRERPDVRLFVYNAAYTGYEQGVFSVDSLAMAHTTVEVNVRSVLTLTHAFLNARRARDEGGGLVLMSSMAGLVGSAHLSVYAATKAWTTAFATGLHEELKSDGIDVLSCIAGATTTGNYLKDALASRSRLIEQSPSAVVDECAAALGRSPTRATGFVNRFAQALLTRLLPTSVAAKVMSDGALSTTKFGLVGPWAKQQESSKGTASDNGHPDAWIMNEEHERRETHAHM
jgi:short-subunit dehydrogenase